MFQFKQVAGTAESRSRTHHAALPPRRPEPEGQERSLREVRVMRGRTLGLLLAVLVCSSCASMQVRPQAHHEVLFCQGPTVETGNCSSADIRALERAIFGLPGQRR